MDVSHDGGRMPKEGSCAGAPLLISGTRIMKKIISKSISSSHKFPKKKLHKNLKKNIDLECREFLQVCKQFQLGHLPTEHSHPLTHNLSDWAQNDLNLALKRLQQVDIEVLEKLDQFLPLVSELTKKFIYILRNEGKIYLGGCGATGRLALVLEKIWRQDCLDLGLELWTDRVVSFMAGGDVALIRSIENFEDHPEFGARQLRELGFSSNDLFIGITEGGETAFVIGATLEARNISGHSPYFLFCNPKEVLIKDINRSREVLEDNFIKSHALSVGPMALSGSTRMQASTILMMILGMALTKIFPIKIDLKEQIHQLILLLKKMPNDKLAKIIMAETNIYTRQERVIYETGDDYAISVLTDTTERSPTFGLAPFENSLDKKDLKSWCYLQVKNTSDPIIAWKKLLGRRPRALNWPKFRGLVEEERLYGYNISAKNHFSQMNKKNVNFFKIFENQNLLSLELDKNKVIFRTMNWPKIFKHTFLKMLLNTHSTLVMGRLGRFHGNWMTYVRPSNYKLIDRAIRYAQGILKDEGQKVSYSDLAQSCFELKKRHPHEAVVMKLVDLWKKKKNHRHKS